MTVRELIQELQKHSPEDQVRLHVRICGEDTDCEIEGVMNVAGTSHLSIVTEDLKPSVDVTVTF